jgi:hypothetical protein
LLAVSFVVIVSINLIRIRIVKSIRGEPVPAAKTSVQTNCQRDATCPIIEEIKSTDDFVNEGQDDQDDDINDQYEDEDYEEDAQNKTASKSDSGVGTIVQSVSNCTITTSGKMSRWQELIEEGEVLNRQKFDMEPKEWVRKKRLVFGILHGSATDETGASSMSPMTKHLFKRK